MAERGLSVDHVTIWRWVLRCAPSQSLKPPKGLPELNLPSLRVRLFSGWVFAVSSTVAHSLTHTPNAPEL